MSDEENPLAGMVTVADLPTIDFDVETAETDVTNLRKLSTSFNELVDSAASKWRALPDYLTADALHPLYQAFLPVQTGDSEFQAAIGSFSGGALEFIDVAKTVTLRMATATKEITDMHGKAPDRIADQVALKTVGGKPPTEPVTWRDDPHLVKLNSELEIAVSQINNLWKSAIEEFQRCLGRIGGSNLRLPGFGGAGDTAYSGTTPALTLLANYFTNLGMKAGGGKLIHDYKDAKTYNEWLANRKGKHTSHPKQDVKLTQNDLTHIEKKHANPTAYADGWKNLLRKSAVANSYYRGDWQEFMEDSIGITLKNPDYMDDEAVNPENNYDSVLYTKDFTISEYDQDGSQTIVAEFKCYVYVTRTSPHYVITAYGVPDDF